MSWESIYGSYMVDQDPFEKMRDTQITLLEIRDLQTGEARYMEDEVRNSYIVSVTAILITLTSLIMAMISLLLYSKDQNWTFLLFFLFSIVMFILGILMAQFGFFAGPKINGGIPINSEKMVFTYILTSICFVFCLSYTIYFSFYRYFHFCNLANLKSNHPKWKNNFGEMGIDSAFDTTDFKIKWLVFITALLAFFLLICLYGMWSVVFNRYKYSAYSYLLSSLLVIIFGFLVLYWCREADSWLNYPQNEQRLGSTGLVYWVKICSIIAIGIAVTAIVLRVIGTQSRHLIFGISVLCLTIVFLTCSGLVLRNVYSELQNKPPTGVECKSRLLVVDEKILKPWCQEKYILSGQTCSKEFLAREWEEENNGIVGSLNPLCCESLKCFNSWPFFLMGFFAFVVCINLVILVATNFYFSENFGLHAIMRKLDIFDCVIFILIVLSLVGFLIYFLARKQDGGSNKKLDEYWSFNKKNFEDERFPRLKENEEKKVENFKGEFNWNYDLNKSPKFQKSQECQSETECRMRIMILGVNSKIQENVDFKNFNLKKGSENSRLNFFPDCTNSDNEYIFYYGNEASINEYLKNLSYSIKQHAGVPKPDIYIYVDQVRASLLDDEGLKKSEKKFEKLNLNDEKNCGNEFKIQTREQDCVKTGCRYLYNNQNDFDFLKLKGKIFYIWNSKEEVEKVHDGIDLSVYSENGDKISKGKILTEGNFEIEKLPKSRSKNQKIFLRIDDKSKVFLDNEVERVIPRSSVGVYSIGKIRVFEKNLSDRYGSLKVDVIDIENGKILENPEIEIFENFNGKKKLNNFMEKNEFEKLKFGAYYLVLKEKGYQQLNSKEAIVDQVFSNKTIFAIPQNTTYKMLITKESSKDGSNIDLSMIIKNQKNESCEASNLNNFCAYFSFEEFSSPKNSYFQVIKLKEYSLGKYKTILTPSPDFNGTCPLYNKKNSSSQENWDFENFRKTEKMKNSEIIVKLFVNDGTNFVEDRTEYISTLENLNLDTDSYGIACFTGFGKNSISDLRKFSKENFSDFSDCDSVVNPEYSMDKLIQQEHN